MQNDISVGEIKNAFEGVDYIISLEKDENEKIKVGGIVQEKQSL